MKLDELKVYIKELFGNVDLDNPNDEYAFNVVCKNEFRKIGYATNLTVDVVEEAVKNNVDLLVTHHDAWENILFEVKESCIKKLSEAGISHFFVHLPLDDADFGTNASLIKKIGVNASEKTNIYEGFYCGRVGEIDEPMEFFDFIKKVESILDEPVRSWKNNDRPIMRIGIVAGGGATTTDLKEIAENNCDVYITGEKSLYTVLYSKARDINLIVGSHTYTEIFGVEGLVLRIKDKFTDIEILRLNEGHFE